MIEKALRKLARKRGEKAFSVWQIELTTRCPLQCKMCIRRESDRWQEQDMPFERFKSLLPYLRDVESVVLEGWGESLLYPELTQCVSLVKREGSHVGFVTSGKELTKDRVSELVGAGLDFVGFSIAGATPETHAAIRVNSHLPEILEAIRFFKEEKIRQRTDRPRMHLVCLMVKDNVTEIPAVPSWAREAGVDEVVLTNICHTINQWQEEQRVFVWEKKENGFEPILKQAEVNARRLNIRLRRPSLCRVDVPVCEENPLRNLYISTGGEVSPCVYLYPPLGSPFRRIFCGEEHWVERVSFGNIFDAPFARTWENDGYTRFRGCFAERRAKSKDAFLSLWDSTRMGPLRVTSLPEPPEPCKTCHKILGV